MKKATPWTVDAHCHWSDERVFATAVPEISALIEKGVAGFVLGGVSPLEWQRQLKLRTQLPGRIFTAFGLHPYFVAQTSTAELEKAWAELQTLVAQADVLGEMGLDFRRQFLSAGKEIQLDFFRRQLQLAREVKKPVVLHIVRAHEEALRELRGVSGMVHAFTAGPSVARRYLDLDLSLSIGAKLLHPETRDLAESVRLAPLERLLAESDCPDQPPPGKNVHDSSTVWSVLQKISEIKNLPFARVVEQTRANLFTLLGQEPPHGT